MKFPVHLTFKQVGIIATTLVFYANAPPHKRLLSFEPHSFPLFDQSEFGSHILKPFAPMRTSQLERVSYVCGEERCVTSLKTAA